MKTLLIDLDNTLCECGKYYEEAVQTAARLIAGTSMDAALVAEIINACDGLLISSRGRDSFKLSRLRDTFRHAASMVEHMRGRPADCDMTPDEISDCAMAHILDAEYPLFPGAAEVLAMYARAGWRLSIWTKGEREFQFRKYWKNELDLWVMPGDFHVTEIKTAAELYRLVYNYPYLKNAVVVGDSYRDEISAALSMGMPAIHVVADHRHPHGYESGALGPNVIASFSELPTQLPP